MDKPSTPDAAVASPYKSAFEELNVLRGTVRTLCRRYAEKIEMEITAVQERILTAGAAPPRRKADILAQVHDLRDMLTLLRTLDLKPEAGRRKDMKKVESVVEDLQAFVKAWG